MHTTDIQYYNSFYVIQHIYIRLSQENIYHLFVEFYDFGQLTTRFKNHFSYKTKISTIIRYLSYNLCAFSKF